MTRTPLTTTWRAGGFLLALVVAVTTLATACSEEDQTPDLDSGVPTVLGGVTISSASGNPTCGDFNENWEELRLEGSEIAVGSYTSDDGYLTFDITDVYDKQFDWSSNVSVDAVFVKGGPGGNLYTYNPEAFGDEGLNAFRNGKNYGLSHISVCYDIEFARISITPDATNEVDDEHTFDVLVEQKIGLDGTWGPVADGTTVAVSLTATNGASVSGVSDDCASPGTVDGMCSITFTSPSAGQVTGHAAATPNVGGSLIPVETNGQDENSGDALKTFVDASIGIETDGMNGIGESHTFTVTASQDDGTGSPGPVADGTIIDVSLIASGDAIAAVSSDTCATGTTGGMCEVTFTSDAAGTIDGHATMTLTFGELQVTRETDGSASNSDDAHKVFVAGSLIWHKVDDDAVPFGGTTFEVCRTHAWDSASSMMVDITDECQSVVDNGSVDEDTDDGAFQMTGLYLGRYTVAETAGLPGYEPDFTPQTVDLTPTSSVGILSADFVNTLDAWITIGPDDTNGIGESHTFTVNAMWDDGLGTDVPVPDGTIVAVTLTEAGGANVVSVTDECGTTGTVSGSCTVEFVSDAAGTVTGHASASISDGGPVVFVETDGVAPNSGDAVKTYVAGSIAWSKVDQDDNPFAGTTFEVCRTHDWSSETSSMVERTTPDCVSVTDNASPDEDAADGEFLLSDLLLGRYTVHETAAPPGYEPDPTTQTVDLTTSSPDATLSAAFVNDFDAWITIEPDDINGVGESHTFTVNAMWDDGTGNDVPVPDGTTIVVTLTEGGGAAVSGLVDTCATGTSGGSCTVSFTSATAGTVTGHASMTIAGPPQIHVETDGISPNSDDAVKTFVAGSLIWTKVDDDGLAFGGTTFEVCRTHDWNSTTDTMDLLTTPVCFSVTDNASPDTDPDDGDFHLTGLTLGTYTVHETAGPPGYQPDPTTQTAELRPTSPIGLLTSSFVNTLDAEISISPDGVNGIGESHTFTVSAMYDDGTGTDVPVPDNTIIVVTLTESGGASITSLTDVCGTTGTTGGSCTVTFTSNTAGSVTGHAAMTISNGGPVIFVETDGIAPNSDDAVKEFVSGSLQWFKLDDLGNPLGGATFEVCKTHDWVTGSGMVMIAPECQSFLDNTGADEDLDDGEFLMTGLELGTYTVEETVPPAGYVASTGIQTVQLTPSTPIGLLTAAFINTPEIPTACSPGFWKTHWVFWDEATDPVAVAAGFTTTTSFNAFFSLTPAESGFADSLTMLQAVNLGGGDGEKLARHGISGLLNIASGYPYSYSNDATALYNEIRNAYLTSTFEPLASNLDTANNADCPLP